MMEAMLLSCHNFPFEQSRKSLLGKVLGFKGTYYDLSIFLISEIQVDRTFVLFYV